MQKGMLSGQLAKASWYGFQSSLLKHNWRLEEMVDARVGDHTPGTTHGCKLPISFTTGLESVHGVPVGKGRLDPGAAVRRSLQ